MVFVIAPGATEKFITWLSEYGLPSTLPVNVCTSLQVLIGPAATQSGLPTKNVLVPVAKPVVLNAALLGLL